MKKSIKILCIIVLFIILSINNNIYAADKVAKVSLSPNKTKLNIGDTVTVDVKLSNITLTNGVAYALGQLEYNQDVFELVYEDTSSLQDIDLDELAEEYGADKLGIASYDEDGWYLMLR